MRDEVTGQWGKLHKGILWCVHSKYYSADKIEKNEKCGHVARMWERSGTYRVLLGNPRRRDRLEEPGVDGKIILKWIFRKWDVEVWTGYSWLRIGTGGGQL